MRRYNSNNADKEYFKERAKWLQFFFERFDPLSHLLMISLFIAGHLSIVGEAFSFKIVLIFLGTTIFFFKLRCFDEIKDFDLDMVINSKRPLPRGLLNVFDMKDAVILCLIFENVIFYSIDVSAGIAMSISSVYSLIMYKEFLIGSKFRDKLTSYATAHTLVTILLSLSIFCALENKSYLELNSKYYFFSLVSWLLFNIFELGRKMFLLSEERDQVESYSKVWGKFGAVTLVIGHAVIVIGLLFYIGSLTSLFSQIYFGISFLLFLVIGLFYLINNNGRSGALFRGYSSFFIILIYLGIVIDKII